MKLYCEHTALLQPDGKWGLYPALVEIDHAHIRAVTKGSSKELPDDTINLKGKMLTPAFVNAHTHLAMNFFRALSIGESASGNMVTDFYFQVESRLAPEDVRAFARMGAYESLLFGVGFVWDHYYHGEALAQALEDVGLSGVVAPTLQDLQGPGAEHWEREWRNTEAVASSRHLAEKGIVAAWGPHATDTVSPSLWKMIRETGSGLPFHAHLAQSREEFQSIWSREQCSPLQFLARLGMFSEERPAMLAHGIYLHDRDLSFLASQPNASLVSCPFSQIIFDFPANICEWERKKIAWAVATDCTPSNDSFNVQKELRMVSGFPLQELSYSPNYAGFRTGQNDLGTLTRQRRKIWDDSGPFRDSSFLLSKIWDTPGKLHPQVRTGTLDSGALANFIVWDLEHPTFWPAHSLRAVAFNDSTPAIHRMMVAGQWLGREGEFAQSIVSSQTYKEALTEANERLKSLAKRIAST
ncbi:MAG: amidohydrolase family protein [Deltaproteobacteria bacterium]|nr:amidohydrolase family protein [Deltaproteobacteria bacterium]